MPNSHSSREGDSPRLPAYRRHKPSGQAVATLSGRDIYLGLYGSRDSRAEYDRVIGEWLAAGRQLPRPESDITIAEVAVRYLNFAKGYYARDGRPTESLDRVKTALRLLKQSYAHTLAKDLGPLALQAIQQKLARSGKSRRYCNYLAETIKRCFKWAVSQELLPETVYRALATVAGLKQGRSPAREPEPIRPVDDAVVDATLPYLPPTIAGMVKVQRATGCRPGEVCLLRPGDIDRNGEVWAFVPRVHKTDYCGKRRVIFTAPRGRRRCSPGCPAARNNTASALFVPRHVSRLPRPTGRTEGRGPITPDPQPFLHSWQKAAVPRHPP